LILTPEPVLTANQAALWYALRLAGVGAKVDDYGQVFEKTGTRERKIMAA
jgi:maleate cis-trans isomerase